MKRIITIILLLNVLSVPLAKAQKEANHWFFGPGLDFSNGAPVPDNNGVLGFPGEGCASISDANGNLLFYHPNRYSDFDTVFNRLHLPMANGHGIHGNTSSVQGSLIIKKPGSNSIYYLFSCTGIGSGSMTNGIYYNEIDMSLAAGNGSVTAKNIPLYTSSTWGVSELMSGVRHCNGTDYWVMTRDNQIGNKYRCFLVSSSGVSTSPVISTVGPNINSTQGQIKFSPNGRKMARTLFGLDPPCLFDFDAATGLLSNPLVLNASGNFSEFSADGTKYYAMCLEVLNQWDLCAGTTTTSVLNSIYTASVAPNGTRSFGDMQLGPDGKIYLTSFEGPQNYSISVIASPKLSGSACNFILDGQSVGNRVAYWALPNFVSSYFKQVPAAFTFTAGSCKNVAFNAPMLNCSTALPVYTGMSWNFGDPSSGAQNQSTLTNVTHSFSAPGTYTVKLIQYTSCQADSIESLVTVTSINSINISNSVTICKGAKTTLTASGAATYSWSNGATTSTIAVVPAVTTTYVVSGTISPGCTANNSVVVKLAECTELTEFEAEDKIRIYPNPFGNELNVEHQGIMDVTITDVAGSLVYSSKLLPGKQKLDLGTLSKGIYILRVNGQSSKSIKLLKTE